MAQPDLSTNTTATLQENSGQITIGKYVVQIGSIHGGMVNIAMPEEQAHWQTRLIQFCCVRAAFPVCWIEPWRPVL